jgi:hypothetical protein
MAEALFGDGTRAAASARQQLQHSIDGGTLNGKFDAIIYSLAVLSRYERYELCAQADGYLAAKGAIAYNTLGGMYRLSVAAAHEAISDDRYTALAAEGAAADWQVLAAQILDVLDALPVTIAT